MHESVHGNVIPFVWTRVEVFNTSKKHTSKQKAAATASSSSSKWHLREELAEGTWPDMSARNRARMKVSARPSWDPLGASCVLPYGETIDPRLPDKTNYYAPIFSRDDWGKALAEIRIPSAMDRISHVVHGPLCRQRVVAPSTSSKEGGGQQLVVPDGNKNKTKTSTLGKTTTATISENAKFEPVSLLLTVSNKNNALAIWSSNNDAPLLTISELCPDRWGPIQDILLSNDCQTIFLCGHNGYCAFLRCSSRWLNKATNVNVEYFQKIHSPDFIEKEMEKEQAMALSNSSAAPVVGGFYDENEMLQQPELQEHQHFGHGAMGGASTSSALLRSRATGASSPHGKLVEPVLMTRLFANDTEYRAEQQLHRAMVEANFTNDTTEFAAAVDAIFQEDRSGTEDHDQVAVGEEEEGERAPGNVIGREFLVTGGGEDDTDHMFSSAGEVTENTIEFDLDQATANFDSLFNAAGDIDFDFVNDLADALFGGSPVAGIMETSVKEPQKHHSKINSAPEQSRAASLSKDELHLLESLLEDLASSSRTPAGLSLAKTQHKKAINRRFHPAIVPRADASNKSVVFSIPTFLGPSGEVLDVVVPAQLPSFPRQHQPFKKLEEETEDPGGVLHRLPEPLLDALLTLTDSPQIMSSYIATAQEDGTGARPGISVKQGLVIRNVLEKFATPECSATTRAEIANYYARILLPSASEVQQDGPVSKINPASTNTSPSSENKERSKTTNDEQDEKDRSAVQTNTKPGLIVEEEQKVALLADEIDTVEEQENDAMAFLTTSMNREVMAGRLVPSPPSFERDHRRNNLSTTSPLYYYSFGIASKEQFPVSSENELVYREQPSLQLVTLIHRVPNTTLAFVVFEACKLGLFKSGVCCLPPVLLPFPVEMLSVSKTSAFLVAVGMPEQTIAAADTTTMLSQLILPPVQRVIVLDFHLRVHTITAPLPVVPKKIYVLPSGVVCLETQTSSSKTYSSTGDPKSFLATSSGTLFYNKSTAAWMSAEPREVSNMYAVPPDFAELANDLDFPNPDPVTLKFGLDARVNAGATKYQDWRFSFAQASEERAFLGRRDLEQKFLLSQYIGEGREKVLALANGVAVGRAGGLMASRGRSTAAGAAASRGTGSSNYYNSTFEDQLNFYGFALAGERLLNNRAVVIPAVRRTRRGMSAPGVSSSFGSSRPRPDDNANEPPEAEHHDLVLAGKQVHRQGASSVGVVSSTSVRDRNYNALGNSSTSTRRIDHQNPILSAYERWNYFSLGLATRSERIDSAALQLKDSLSLSAVSARDLIARSKSVVAPGVEGSGSQVKRMKA
ncbi:unnamed protein product [Amoebophrya sp. A120]|nr:unnamed protein product [Amoebophrya sp. A120]|eukprot:GSA120T00020778001.1